MNAGRAARKSRNAQRRADRSAHRESLATELETLFTTLDAELLDEAVLIRCCECGLEQVSPGPETCVVCGSVAGWFVRRADAADALE